MNLRYGGEDHEIPSENWLILHYPLPMDILDGMYVDLEDDYAHITLHDSTGVNQKGIEAARTGGAEDIDLTDSVIDLDEPPHQWVVNSVGRMIVATCEELLKEAAN